MAPWRQRPHDPAFVYAVLMGVLVMLALAFLVAAMTDALH